MARLFGTDGVRGVVNEFLTPELAYHLGRAAGTHFGKEKEHPMFLIGRDTRISGSMLESALAAGHLLCWWQCSNCRCYPNTCSSVSCTATRF